MLPSIEDISETLRIMYCSKDARPGVWINSDINIKTNHRSFYVCSSATPSMKSYWLLNIMQNTYQISCFINGISDKLFGDNHLRIGQYSIELQLTTQEKLEFQMLYFS